MNPYRTQVAGALEATRFPSPAGYSWFGETSSRLLKAQRAPAKEAARSYLLYNLQQRLYDDFYIHGYARPASQPGGRRPSGVITPFVKALSAANTGQGYWERGWTVEAIEGQRVVATRNGLSLWARREDCLPSEGNGLVPGVEARLRLPGERFDMSPGYYAALGDRDLLEDGPVSIVRSYWNLTPEGALQLMRRATSMLNAARLAFQLKALKDETRYERCDAAVLYVRKSDYESVREVLESIYPGLVDQLKDPVPAFTKPLAKGLGLAEDPGFGESFGQHRCRLVAEAMIRAQEQGKRTIDDRLRTVEERFREAGLSFDEPFLSPGSTDDYTFAARTEVPLS